MFPGRQARFQMTVLLPATEKGKRSRAGAPNYSESDVNALLDIVAVVEPLGANQWAIVAQQFNNWCTANDRPERDMDSVKTNSTNSPTRKTQLEIHNALFLSVEPKK